jgi:putative membrane protein insertion efficiency factor
VPAGRSAIPAPRRLPRHLGIGIVRLYQLLVSPLLPANTCKYHPSCSQYAVDALRKYGLVRGSWKAVGRLLRCHPWSRGGVDYA